MVRQRGETKRWRVKDEKLEEERDVNGEGGGGGEGKVKWN